MRMEKEENPKTEMVENVMETLTTIKVYVTLAKKITGHDV